MSKKKLFFPRFKERGIFVEVDSNDDEKIAAYVAAGWLKSKPRPKRSNEPVEPVEENAQETPSTGDGEAQ